MPPLYDDVNRLAAVRLQQNPTALAGLADFDDDPEALASALQRLATRLAYNGWRCSHDAGATLFALIRVAQDEYGGGDAGYWPHLESRLLDHLRQPLDQPLQRRLGEWFRDGLKYFGYAVEAPGHANVGLILWHAAWSRRQLGKLMGFVADQVAVYGKGAAEPDALYDLRLGSVAQDCLQLPTTLRRLLTKGAAGMGDLWARLAGAALLARREGRDAVRKAWEPIGGISAEDVLNALPPAATAPASSISGPPLPRRPRLRYHPESGEIRLWLVDGTPSDWNFGELKVSWQGSSGEVAPPLPANYTVTHSRTGATWKEALYCDKRPAVWFNGRSGALVRGDDVKAQGLQAGKHFLVCRGARDGRSAFRLPLPLGYFAGGEGWAAWEVEVPPRSDSAQGSSHVVRVDGAEWMFLLARGEPAVVRTECEPAAYGELSDGARVAMFAAPPRIALRPGATVRILRGGEQTLPLVVEWTVQQGVQTLPDCGPGVFQLRESRGGRRVLLDYAVLPGLKPPAVATAGDAARLTLEAGPFGRLEQGAAAGGGWMVEGPACEPWLEAVWKWNVPDAAPVRLRAAVPAVRWRLADRAGPQSPWTRAPKSVRRREAAARQLRLEVEVPDRNGLTVNGASPIAEPIRGPTGWRLFLPLDAFSADDEIRIRCSDGEFTAAYLADYALLRSFQAAAEGGMLKARWDAEHVPVGTAAIGTWDPTDPAGAVNMHPLSAEHLQDGSWTGPAPAGLAAGRLAIALGTKGRGVGARLFEPAKAAADGAPMAALIECNEGSSSGWTRIAHAWTIRSKWGAAKGFAPLADLQGLGAEPPWNEVRDYLSRLPADGPLRAQLSAALQGCVDGGLGKELAVRTVRSAEPTAELRCWLAAGVHPLWGGFPAVEPTPRDLPYPFHYLSRLAVLDDAAAPLEVRAAAAWDVDQFHKNFRLFSPLDGLPMAAGTHRGVPLTIRGRTREGVGHCHHVECATHVGEAEFVAQTTGLDAVWDLYSAAEDPRPAEPPRAVVGLAVRPARRRFEVGRVGECWEVGLHDAGGYDARIYRACCRTEKAMTVPAWLPRDLVARLKLVDWLLERSHGLPAPAAVLPPEFDALLFAGPLGEVHRRVLETPKLVDKSLSLSGRNSWVRTLEYTDAPPAGKAAWRLAWLDRLEPAERRRIRDWSPFMAALHEALGSGSERWNELFSACVAAAEYVRRVLAGGIGPVIRFAPAPLEDSRS